jgi:DNA-binding transcriptional ArsR family regulator
MTAQRPDDLDDIVGALADPTRRRLFEAILRSPGLSTSELVERAPAITRWGVMKHLESLRRAGLIQTMATGRLRRHYAERARLAPLRAWLDALERGS